MRKPIILIALLLSVYLFANRLNTLAASNHTVQVSFIDVGQGDAVLIEDSSGFNILLDGGRSSAGPTVVAYLHQKEIDIIDVIIASHAHADHIGGLISVLEDPDILVQEVLYNGYPYDSITWEIFSTKVADQGITMTAAQYPQVYDWGSTTAFILNPDPDLMEVDQNQSSVVVLLVHESNRFLFSGDIDLTAEATVVARGTPLAAEILKVAHHGSRFSSGEDSLAEISPLEAVIQVGANPYGHPAPETLERLEKAAARIWRNDVYGTIVVKSDGMSFTIYHLGKNPIYFPIVFVNEDSGLELTHTSTPVPSLTTTP
ncbi:MAG: ComEC/Rec2 family competence protein [Anaerolineales bacterium]